MEVPKTFWHNVDNHDSALSGVNDRDSRCVGRIKESDTPHLEVAGMYKCHLYISITFQEEVLPRKTNLLRRSGIAVDTLAIISTIFMSSAFSLASVVDLIHRSARHPDSIMMSQLLGTIFPFLSSACGHNNCPRALFDPWSRCQPSCYILNASSH